MGAKHYRSRRAAVATMSAELRNQGWSWGRIATRIQGEHRVNARVAMRLAHGLSQQGAADRWNERFPCRDGESPMTAKKLSYWETWPESGREPSLTALQRLAVVYECETRDLIDGDVPPVQEPAAPVQSFEVQRNVRLPHELAASVLRQLGPLTDGALAARERDAVFGRLINSLTVWADTVNRRDVMRILGSAALAAAAAPVVEALDPEEEARAAGAVAGTRQIDASVIEHFERMLWVAKDLDDTSGPVAALDTVLAQRNLIRTLLANCPARLRPRLLSLYANASHVAGWMSFDCNDYDSAEYYYEHARSTAHEAHNVELGAYALCTMSYLATWRGKPRVGIDHAVAARAWAGRTSNNGLRAYAADVAARAYAADDEYDECMRALDEAHACLAMPAGDSSLTTFSYDGTEGRCGPSFLTSIRAGCLVKLGRYEEAAVAADASLRHLDPSYVRNFAMTKLDSGRALIGLGEVEGAARSVGEAGDLAAAIHSTRTMEQVRTTARQLEPWSATPAVRDLQERLTR